MKHWILAVVGSLFVGSVALAAPELVQSPVDKVFTPLGFDDNDDVEVVLHGDFPNSCYKVGPASAKVDVVNHKIIIEAKAWYYLDGVCVQMTIPFIQPVKMGMVPQGDYEIIVLDRPSTDTTPLFVALSTSRSPDDYTYAPVSEVGLKKEADGSYELAVDGVYPYMFVGCMKIVEVRAQVTPGHVLVVQPIAEIFPDDSSCPDQATTKNYRVTKKLTDLTDAAEYLAHVRALSGQSVNRLFDLTL